MENRNEKAAQQSARDVELERLALYPDAPYMLGAARAPIFRGVLLSDQIEYYCRHFKLLDPFQPANLKPAAYELRVGFKYSVAGKTRDLKIDQELIIPKFEVAVIEILETVNMPRFLIGRWNIRTKWAYRGLIWVGGPQVDPGYRGILLCPVWNLSSSDFPIRSGEPIAVMDFEITTPPTVSSIEYKWRDRSRVTFDDYHPHLLKSGLGELITDSVREISEIKSDATSVRNRVDTFVAVTFAALAVLITAVTLFATKPEGLKYWWDPTIFWECIGVTILAMLAWTRSRSAGKWTGWTEAAVVILALLSLGLLGWRTHVQLKALSQRIEILERQVPPQKESKLPLSGSKQQANDNNKDHEENNPLR